MMTLLCCMQFNGAGITVPCISTSFWRTQRCSLRGGSTPRRLHNACIYWSSENQPQSLCWTILLQEHPWGQRYWIRLRWSTLRQRVCYGREEFLYTNQITKQPTPTHPSDTVLLRIFTIKMVICFPFHFFLLLFLHSASKKTGWTEEQEDELRQLFMENQNNPSTEKGNYTVQHWVCKKNEHKY